MKLLYFSCHSILEYDELKLFQELGIDWYSLGAYTFPRASGDTKRPIIDYTPDSWLTEHSPDRDHIPQEFMDHFDTVMIMHMPDWIEKNWHMFKNKRVIWRTIGQSVPLIEARMLYYKERGMEIVRYSPKERNLASYAGESALIRFYKDPEEYKNWNGENPTVINFTQSLRQRGTSCGYNLIMNATEGFKRKIYGPENGDLGKDWGGKVDSVEQMGILRDNRVYFYHGTAPASYVLSLIEAMMTGIPIVAVGSGLNKEVFGQDTNEIEDIIQNGINGYVSNSMSELRNYIKLLLNDKELAKKIGEAGRRTAISLFGKERIKQEWKDFLKI